MPVVSLVSRGTGILPVLSLLLSYVPVGLGSLKEKNSIHLPFFCSLHPTLKRPKAVESSLKWLTHFLSSSPIAQILTLSIDNRE